MVRGIPLYIKCLLLFVKKRTQIGIDITENFDTTATLVYKILNGTIYILKDSVVVVDNRSKHD